MTALDQSFIKVFRRPEPEPLKAPAAPARVTLSEAMRAREPAAPPAAVAPVAPPAEASQPAQPQPAQPQAAPRAEIQVEMLEEPRFATPPGPIARATAARLERLAASKSSPELLPLRRPDLRSELGTLPPPPASPRGESAKPTKQPTKPAKPEPTADDEPDAPQTILRLLRPALRLECFPWPSAVMRLGKEAGKALETVAAAAIEASRRGVKVIGLTACQTGEGTTTVALALTKRLATPQRRVALVDAHGADPQIARRLGILAQNGWETVLAGRRTLADVMVEAADVHLAVLPLCGAPPTDGFDEGMSDAIGALRQNYDTVVVDLPPVSPKACGALKHVDAVIMVQHEAISAMARLVAVQKHLAEAEVELLGVVQNFAGE